MRREMSANGAFYPGRAIEIERYFEHFSTTYDEETVLPDVQSRAVIVPHAGYIYSGYSANVAYRILQKSGVKKFVVIGPSHKVGFDGVSLCNFTAYETPLGDINGSDFLFQKLKERFHLSCFVEAHAEHSTEVQFPFIKHYIEDAEIVELVYSYASAKMLCEIIDFVLNEKECGVIISTDLSHFYTLSNAARLDNICLEAIERLDTKRLHDGCEACGMIGIEAALLSAKKQGLKSLLLDYRTSADASGDTQRVVGYVSACFYE
ncbi:AmmeMemoRadiSam system protein B [Sulfurimonas sp. RIFOXYB12_FULL_35_9]|uniref:AmmeMemoRadiSam system protein B n=1 Tax=Sulfurimonas sp. RIFOXYB12_FULL_35_9 TaxID=1802256 RepID=UPI0008D77AA5|nr:AmmeMemoRadiSam system protein B [Sulfurimonas sp. RIFOXYB12_FULL_35_9]OHE06363.1 MAG: AmmeMemoRadiSam system protein B [Sulfurimonas sp. RIFOXYB12_FULL_35_9]